MSQAVFWFLWSHPRCRWECISECHYQLWRKSLDQNNYISFLVFCMANQSHRVGSKKLAYLEYCISELITLLTLDFFFTYSLILLKMQINLSDQQKKNKKHLWKSLKQPSLAFAIECYANSCWLEREREVSQGKVTRETSSKKDLLFADLATWLVELTRKIITNLVTHKEKVLQHHALQKLLLESSIWETQHLAVATPMILKQPCILLLSLILFTTITYVSSLN